VALAPSTGGVDAGHPTGEFESAPLDHDLGENADVLA
jgi:hypothetical protein